MARRTVIRLVALCFGLGLLGVTTFLLFGCVLLLIDGPPRDEWGFVGGKDAVDSFGGGRWALVKTGSRTDGTRRLHLSDRKALDMVVVDVTDWRQLAHKLFVLGRDGKYTVLDLRTGAVQRYEQAEDATEDDGRILNSLRVK